MAYKTVAACLILALGITSWAYAQGKKSPSDRERIAALETEVQALRSELNHVHQEDVPNLFGRTNDLRMWIESLVEADDDIQVPPAADQRAKQ